jgi:hypothetical protein
MRLWAIALNLANHAAFALVFALVYLGGLFISWLKIAPLLDRPVTVCNSFRAIVLRFVVAGTWATYIVTLLLWVLTIERVLARRCWCTVLVCGSVTSEDFNMVKYFAHCTLLLESLLPPIIFDNLKVCCLLWLFLIGETTCCTFLQQV